MAYHLMVSRILVESRFSRNPASFSIDCKPLSAFNAGIVPGNFSKSCGYQLSHNIYADTSLLALIRFLFFLFRFHWRFFAVLELVFAIAAF